ncbi:MULTISPECIES: phosphoribosylamine--glycine ligase [Chryseobacterium]|jgi:phosphoribosylamine--glycine ligase|uniref:Phosphoribosylamine--glycine ligase n=1 Tax=Chryseobacterium aquaticum subsp. greenlandense TaxID=345663 RepID=A0A117KC37_9FLAO|nr:MULTISPECIES: phosphoribosylamine--glycine ligase [Chryseobacterium]KNB60739.1 phosphoribosylamine--glycine ligase [Chryseobacterium sp. Hurlbut01]KUJ56698.1 phosphoribosylamine--glycine ligase [Chryseobacterium aquaticum subsp. greenlandense]
MRILIIGEGGRESALAAKLQKDVRVTKMFFANGNASTDAIGQNVHMSEIKELRDFAIKEKVDLTIVGPEAPLVAGLKDEFKKHGLKVFGPNQKVASLEGSKAFSKKFMQTYDIKTAKAVVFDSYNEAKEYVQKHEYPLVIKASGLAGGKGVVICDTVEEAEATIHDFMIRRIYGDAGIRLVIEEFLQGFEASIIAFSNGEKLFPCIPVKDYKKAGNGDKGPNTGGMGSVAPSPEFTAEHSADFEKNILAPTITGLKAEGFSFKGIIFFGLMVTKNGTYLLEYNMRFGDPETQVLMALMENNLLDVIMDCMNGKDIDLKFKDEKAVCLVMCSGGYPRNIELGFEILGEDKVKHSQLLYAGAIKKGNKVVSNGGRVLNIIATGATYDEARKKVYEDALPVHFDYSFYREDIGKF